MATTSSVGSSRTIVRKWGNSPAVRLPVAVMNAACIELEQDVQISVEEGRIIIEPVATVDYSLERLVKGITRGNSHPEADFGAPAGRERG